MEDLLTAITTCFKERERQSREGEIERERERGKEGGREGRREG